MLDWRLTTGPLPIMVLVLGLAGFAWLLLTDRKPRWWTRRVPLAIGVGVLVMVLAIVVVDYLWQPFPDPLPVVVSVAILLIATAVMLAVLQRVSWRQRIVSVIAVLLVALASGSLVNTYFGAYHTVRQLLGLKEADEVDFGSIVRPGQSTPNGTEPQTSHAGPMPATGTLTSTPVPGATSGFQARDALIYLPPAYGYSEKPLPVMVLMAGQPGEPRNWVDGSSLVQTLDGYAAAHGGEAPVVVVADQLGESEADPGCFDSPLGNVFSYLSVDVPAWVEQNLVVDRDHRHWAIGGLSAGGTCSLQMAVNAPTVYPIFIDLSGERDAGGADTQKTIKTYFGGDAAAFAKVNPLDVMAGKQFPDTSGFIGVGADDSEFRPQAKDVYAAAQAAGMTATYVEVPGEHTFNTWGTLFQQALPWAAPKMGLP